MAFKLLKVNFSMVVKGDPNDREDLKERIYEMIQVAVENDDLEFSLDEDEEEAELED